MVSHLFYYQLALWVLIWLFVMLHLGWPRRNVTLPPAPDTPMKSKRKRSTEPKSFEGLTHKPHCALCEQETGETKPPPPVRPDPMPPTNRRPRTVDTSMHFCPHDGCRYRGWLELNNLRANGHPNGAPWRQFQCLSCLGYFPEHHGTIFHGKQAAVELIVRVLACLAEGLGIRAAARVFEVAPNTVLQWLVEAAEQLRAFSAYFLCDLHLEQLQLDEVYAVLRALKAGEISDDEPVDTAASAPLLLLRQWLYDAQERPTLFMWDALTSQPMLLSPATADPTRAAQTGAVHVAAGVDRVTARVRVRALDHDVVRSLVASGDLPAAVDENLPTWTVGATQLEWTSDRGAACLP